MLATSAGNEVCIKKSWEHLFDGDIELKRQPADKMLRPKDMPPVDRLLSGVANQDSRCPSHRQSLSAWRAEDG